MDHLRSISTQDSEPRTASGMEMARVHSWREGVAVLALRLILGATMFWAGLGKFYPGYFTAEQAAYLDSVGVVGLTPSPGIKPIDDRHYKGELPSDSVRALNLHYVTLITRAAAVPEQGAAVVTPNRHGTAHMAAGHTATESSGNTIPSFLGDGSMPVILAWFSAVVQLVGGSLVLIGLFSRAASVAIIGVMLGATWMTQIGPYAVGGAPGGWMGVLPPIEEGLHPHGWKTVLWQWGLIANAACVALLGPGRVSVGHWVGQIVTGRQDTRHAAASISDETSNRL